MAQLSLDDFQDDVAWGDKVEPSQPLVIPGAIDGVKQLVLERNADRRGHLTVLMSQLSGPIEPLVHVYRVFAETGSVRAWVYHKRQWDRLAYTEGDFRVVLYDIRPGSSTFGQLNIIDLGEVSPSLLFIPPFVIHGVQNRGAPSSFVNMPTQPYDPANPDKSRLAWNHPGVPYQFV